MRVRIKLKLHHLIKRSLTHYWQSNLAIIFGVAVAAAVLVGSLLVGDSVRGSLRELAREQLGGVDHAMVTPGFFRQKLAADLENEMGADASLDLVAPAIIMRGALQRADGGAVAARVNVVGVSDEFWEFAEVSPGASPAGRNVLLNSQLADELEVETGGAVLLRLASRGEAPLDTAFGRRELQDTLKSLRLSVSAVIGTDELGNFSLRNDDPRPRNIFVALGWLQKRLDRPGGANAILVGSTDERRTDRDAEARLSTALGASLQLPDYGLKLRAIEKRNYISLESQRLLLPQGAVEAAQRAAEKEGLHSALTSIYLANSLRRTDDQGETRSVPYSVVAGLDLGAKPPLSAVDMGDIPPLTSNDPGIWIDAWTAQRLQAAAGDRLEMSYYAWEESGQLITRNKEFVIRDVVGMSGLATDPGLVPTFEGLTDAQTMADWDPPFPIDLDRITEDDEEYWEQYRTAPKAFVTLDIAREFWTDEEGEQARWVTSVRFGHRGRHAGRLREPFAGAILSELSPPDFGLSFRPVKELARQAARGSTDFGVLFLSMSMFLLAAAAGLVVLLLRLGIQRRAGQFGILLATGFAPVRAARVLMGEGMILALGGTAVGIPLGVGYAWLIIHLLRTRWSGAVADFPLSLHVGGVSVAGGALGGLAVSVGAIWWAARILRRREPLDLLSGWRALSARPAPRLAARARWLGVAALALAGLLLVASGGFGLVSTTGAFFGGGSLLLIGMMALLVGMLQRTSGAGTSRYPALHRLAWRGAAQNWLRSTLTAGLIACASFVVVTVAANRRDLSLLDVREMDSGAGGFSLLARSSVPVFHDPATTAGREELGFSRENNLRLKDVHMYSFAVNEGDDVSCLNLQKAMRPRLLGVPPTMVQRGGFSFSGVAGNRESPENPWYLLHDTLDSEKNGPVIPAFADAASARWILKVGLGDEIAMTGRDGQTVRLRLVGMIRQSIFAGELLISRENLERYFEPEPGYQYFLVRTSPGEEATVADALRAEMGQLGLEVLPTGEVLASYMRVQNTYLATFRTLGGMGLLLGTLGMVAVLLRSVVERRGQFGVMLALGIRRRGLVGMVLLENAFLLVAGIAIGTVSALLAVAPHLVSQVASVRWLPLMGILGACLLVGLLCCALSAVVSLRTGLLEALRAE
mgnify:CR=1 FL=1